MGVAAFAAGTDILLAVLPRLLADLPITQDVLLSALYAGIIGGIGVGVVYRAGSSMGGTGILGRILQLKTGAPLSQVYFYTDGVIILIAALVFGWETGLYALLTLFVSGLASDYTLEGPSSVRTATIVTDEPERVSQALIAELGRGVSRWEITGAYTGERHAMILCAVYRPQVADVKRVVAEADRDAFVVIGMAHQALGYGFEPLKNPGPNREVGYLNGRGFVLLPHRGPSVSNLASIPHQRLTLGACERILLGQPDHQGKRHRQAKAALHL